MRYPNALSRIAPLDERRGSVHGAYSSTGDAASAGCLHVGPLATGKVLETTPSSQRSWIAITTSLWSAVLRECARSLTAHRRT